jgi:pilus assembly protein FimV
VSLEQMLVALYRENQDAFSGKNMNRLKTGQILKVPSTEEVSAITQPEAVKEVHTQVADWKAYREKLASAAGALPAPTESSNATSGSVTSAAVTPPAPPASASQDSLKLSKSETGGKAGGGAGGNQARLNALQEELVAKDKALRESQSRVADLEKQIQDMQRLLDLKAGAPVGKADTKVAAAPAPAKPAPEPAKPAEPPKAATPEPAKVASAEPAKPAEPAKAEPSTATPPAAATPAEPPKAEGTSPAEPPKTEAKAAPKPAPKKVVPPPKSLMDEVMENPAYLAAGGGVLALALIGGFVVMRRRRRNEELDPNSQMTSAFPSDLKPGGNTSKPAGGLVDTGNSSFLTDFDKTGPGTIDTDEVDPVAEAEVYMAYGRDAQAEEILKEAMARDRNRHEIALKLLEIYHARKSATAFETVAKELHDAVGDNHPLWQKAAAMGAQIDPSNPLYVAAAAGTATYQPLESSAAPAKPNLDFDLDSSSSAATTSSAPAFDLDLDANKPAASAPAVSSSGLDFDLNPSEAPKVDVPVESPKEEKPAFDFDLSGLDFPSSKSSSAAAAAPASSGGGGLDLADLSLDTPAAGDGGEAVGTKLELAKAYLEIGDKDGAREILNEVAKEGSSAQREEAKKLIASL